MSEHLTGERLAALLDEPDSDGPARRHLEACDRCRRELELMRRMRMALSALPLRKAPADQWDRVRESLPAPGVETRSEPVAAGPGRSRPWTDRLAGGWVTPLRAAAAVLIFAAGVGVGLGLGPDVVGHGAWIAGAGTADEGVERAAEAVASAEGVEDRRLAAETPAAADVSLAEMESLLAGGPAPEDVFRDPVAAAERLAELEAFVRAAREVLRADPADPAVNHFLFEAMEEREALGRALHLASLEHR